jgi:hypothetical protein
MSCSLTHTGVFATSEETAELQELAKTARRTPVMALSLAEGLAGWDFASQARKRMQDRLQETAMAHGLPDFEGYYGLTMEGEFVK